ncbi:ATP-dependent helicase [Rhodococcus erythropolis]|uniref:ATP-dependent helicase n=1 Tax=Rhodococcus erythropolis TaxID=1833 RepID=UPI001C9B3D22|nr:ATP-dependent helicase [Rhodococcus erythropolis]MBY6385362.1 ATP-dependent helicase [Rhodococcus erythropolis]
MELSDEQLRALDDDVEVVSACPGAGKTRAIISRFLQEINTSAKGVALVSFTNTAVDEISSRLSSHGKFRSPNFVGTFDRFVHQFIVTPYVLRTTHSRPRYVDSWMDLGNADWLYLRDRSVNGKGIPLSDFVSDADGVISLGSWPSAEGRMYARQLENAGVSIASVTARAKSLIDGLLAKHIYDCDHARILALKILEGTVDDPGPRRLSDRFSEIIIDEFQDCSDIEYRIRDRLKKLGVKVVVVADADQGIYEFRNAKPQMFSDLVKNTPSAAFVELNDNHRSSEVICALVSSMRSMSAESIKARRSFDSDPIAPKIYVLVGSDSYKQGVFRELSARYSIPAKDSIVLAPTRKQAARLAGDASTKFDKGYGSTGALLVLLARLRFGQLPHQRADSVASFTSLVLGLFDWAQVKLEAGAVDEKLEHLGLQHAALRLCLSSLVQYSSDWASRDDAKDAIHAAIIDVTSDLVMKPSSVTMKFQKPREDDWGNWTALGVEVKSDIAHSHIHGVKGKEYPAVLLHIPHENRDGENSGFNSWLMDVDSESRRVLYVGASRAERLLALSIAKTKKDEIISILERTNIPYECRIEEV